MRSSLALLLFVCLVGVVAGVLGYAAGWFGGAQASWWDRTDLGQRVVWERGAGGGTPMHFRFAGFLADEAGCDAFVDDRVLLFAPDELSSASGSLFVFDSDLNERSIARSCVDLLPRGDRLAAQLAATRRVFEAWGNDTDYADIDIALRERDGSMHVRLTLGHRDGLRETFWYEVRAGEVRADRWAATSSLGL